MTKTEDKLIGAEIKKYMKWVKLKGYTSDRYSLIAYLNRKNQVKDIKGIYYVILGKRKYRFDKVEKTFIEN